MKSENVGLIARAISFQDFQPMWSWSIHAPTSQTDGQTDDMRSQDRALHYSASRSKNRTFIALYYIKPWVGCSETWRVAASSTVLLAVQLRCIVVRVYVRLSVCLSVTLVCV